MASKKTKDEPKKRGRTLLGGAKMQINFHPDLKRPGHTNKVCTEAMVVFGRLNPPSVGHERLINEMVDMCDDNTIPLLFLAKSINESNPLTYAQRYMLCEKAFGDKVCVVAEETVNNYLNLFKYVAEHFKKATFLVGSDRFADVSRMLRDYNDKEFVFESYSIRVLDRDPDSDDLLKSISASQMRDMALNESYDDFVEALPTKLREDAQIIFDTLQHEISMQQSLSKQSGNLRKVAVAAIINRETKRG